MDPALTKADGEDGCQISTQINGVGGFGKTTSSGDQRVSGSNPKRGGRGAAWAKGQRQKRALLLEWERRRQETDLKAWRGGTVFVPGVRNGSNGFLQFFRDPKRFYIYEMVYYKCVLL